MASARLKAERLRRQQDYDATRQKMLEGRVLRIIESEGGSLPARWFSSRYTDARVIPWQAALKSQAMTVECTYFFQGEHGGPIKIGRSKLGCVKDRLASVQTGHPEPLICRMVLEGDHEGRLHSEFSDARLRKSGEWFLATDELADLCDAIPDSRRPDAGAAAEAWWRRGYEAGAQAAADATTGAVREALARGLDDVPVLVEECVIWADFSPTGRSEDAGNPTDSVDKECLVNE